MRHEERPIGEPWQVVDRATQRWVVATGREVVVGDHAWLDGPVGDPGGIGEGWIDAYARRVGAVTSASPSSGLLPDMVALDGAAFHAAGLAPPVRGFYEQTAGWSLQLWSQWSRWAEPGGRLVNAVFARRLRQLALPLAPLDVAYGMASQVIEFRAPGGAHLGTAWQRTLRSTGATVFGGFYGIAQLPAERGLSVRVVFPLPNGSLTVFLRPEVGRGGSLVLRSISGPFGSAGAYLVVARDEAHVSVRRVPLHERFDVFVDDVGVLRCDHTLDLGPGRVLRLHYRMEPS